MDNERQARTLAFSTWPRVCRVDPEQLSRNKDLHLGISCTLTEERYHLHGSGTTCCSCRQRTAWLNGTLDVRLMDTRHQTQHKRVTSGVENFSQLSPSQIPTERQLPTWGVVGGLWGGACRCSRGTRCRFTLQCAPPRSIVWAVSTSRPCSGDGKPPQITGWQGGET